MFLILWFILGLMGVVLYFIGMFCCDRRLYLKYEVLIQAGWIYLLGPIGFIFSISSLFFLFFVHKKKDK